METDFFERDIDVWDMFWAVCQHWRSVLLGAVLAAFFAAGLICFQGRQLPSANDAENVEVDDEDRINSQSYLNYLNVYADQLKYNQTSPLMQLDAEGFYAGTLDYFVDNHYKVEYPAIAANDKVNTLIRAYQALLNDENFVGELQNSLGIDGQKDGAYIIEYVDCANLYGLRTDISNNTGAMRITVYAQDEDTCRMLMQLVQDTLQQNEADISRQYEEHDLILLSSTCRLTADSRLLAYQKDNYDKLGIYKLDVDNAKALLPGELQVRIEGLTIDELKASDMYHEKEGQPYLYTEKKINKIVIVIAFVMGAFSVCVFQIVAYAFDKKLRFEDDFEEIYGIKLLGKVEDQRENKKRNFVDNWILKLRRAGQHYFSEKELVDMLSTEMKVFAKTKKVESIYMMGAYLTKENCSLVDKITEKVKKVGVKIQLGETILYHAEALDTISTKDATVLLIKAGQTRYDEVYQMGQICAMLGVIVLGTIIFE